MKNNEEDRKPLHTRKSNVRVCSKRLYKNERGARIKAEALKNVIGLILVLTILGSSTMAYRREAEQYRREQVIETMTKLSTQLSASFSQRAKAQYDELRMISRSINIYNSAQTGDRGIQELHTFLEDFQLSMFDRVGFITQDGYLVFSEKEIYSVTEDADVCALLNGDADQICCIPDTDALREYVLMAVRVEQPYTAGAYTVVGYAGTAPKSEIAQMMETDIFGDSYAYLVLSDEKGNVVLDTESNRKFGNNLIDTFHVFADEPVVSTLQAELESGATNTLELMGTTQRFVIHYTPVEAFETVSNGKTVNNWRMLILTSTETLDKTVHKLFDNFNVLFYCTVASMFIVLLVLSALLARESKKALLLESTDMVTGLLSKNRFKADANLLIRNGGQRYAVVSVNLIDFKMINQKVGHNLANEILGQVGRNISTFLRDNEIAARHHSDRFMVLLDMETEQGGERLRLLEKTIVKADYPYDTKLKVTMGVYRLKDTDRNIETPMDNARFAQATIQKARIRVSNVVFYDERLFEQQKKESILQQTAAPAIGDKEFVIYYQLKRSADRWVGYEALVRWNHKQFGFLSPGEFIDLFERNGFIVKLDHYVFEAVCQTLRKSMDQGEAVLPVSVNLSKRSLEDSNFLDFYRSKLQEYRIPGDLIEFEITETLATMDEARLKEVIQAIQDMGCRCALDDFGTGYSSFDMIRKFRFDTIKLDASFFRDELDFDKNSQTIVETLIGLSHRLGISVVAEGIETEEQSEFLIRRQCDAIQGYFYAKPMPYHLCRELLDKEK